MNQTMLLLGVIVAFALLFAGCGGESKPEGERSARRPVVSDERAPLSPEAARQKPYVASVLRQPFHRCTCRWAKKISTANLVGYDTREQAIADGHRPCKVCKP